MKSINVLSALLVLCLASTPGFGQESAMPVIKIIATGGTIANTLHGRVPIEEVIADIRKNFPETHELLNSVKLEVIDLIRVGSRSLTEEDYLEIVRTVNKVIKESDVKGVIVTQGTSTSEVTAYFLHLLVNSSKPIVLTNSQRAHASVGNDGVKNFVDAVSVILSPDSAGKGALVVTNQTISSGREVHKTSGHPGDFLSGVYGILGIIESDRVDFYRAPTRRHTHQSEFDINSISILPKVEIISVYYNADPALIQAAVKAGAKGIVVNGYTTSGSPHATQQSALEEAANSGITVVVTSRGGVNNRITLGMHKKFIGGDNLLDYKARILLQLALTKTSDPEEIQRIFNEY